MSSGNYSRPKANYDFGDFMSVDEFRSEVASGSFIDYDGSGYAVKGELVDTSQPIYPSSVDMIPDDAEQIVWFNK